MIISQQLEHAPRKPGVYLFYRGTTILYIGKAGNLKNRLASYFRSDAPEKAKRLVLDAEKIEWQEAASEIEALILEAKLIKKHRPKFNITMRDDKSYSYVAITREEFPKIFKTHGPKEKQMANGEWRMAKREYIGPFTDSGALKIVLKLVRKIFPYCTCKTPHKRLCVNAQIGKCLGYCCLKIINGEWRMANGKKEEYRKNIKNIKAILTGKKKKLLRELKKEMKDVVKKEEFERAASARDQIESVENIFRHRMTLDPMPRRRMQKEKLQKILQELFETNQKIKRIEAYDIANISGTAAVGSLVVFLDGKPEKSEYRIFNIKTVQGISDTDMIKEVIRRRIRHPEWRRPDLMVIDGGRGQLNAAGHEVEGWRLEVGGRKKILIVALAKREEELYFPNKKFPVRLSTLPPDAAHFFQHIRDEAHRFAQKQHHKLRSKNFYKI